MDRVPSFEQKIRIPDVLAAELLKLRRKVWTTKLIEAFGAVVAGVALAYLSVFAMDRIGDTPTWLRGCVGVIALAICGLIPYSLHHSVWGQRRFHQLAKLVSKRLPRLGDQLLGIIELSESDAEQARSRALCQAAIDQVAHDPEINQLSSALPRTYHRLMAVLAGIALMIVVTLFALFPTAANNAWERFLTPWREIARYTFAQLMPVENQLVVPHGESFNFGLALTPESAWTPESARITVGGQPSLDIGLAGREYRLSVPGQIQETTLSASVGDWSHDVTIMPKHRPELSAVDVSVELPAYLERQGYGDVDARAGKIGLVKGSKAVITSSANRPLSTAAYNGVQATLKGDKFVSPAVEVSDSTNHELKWTDEYGLAGAKPFQLTIDAKEDAAPVVGVHGIVPNQILLDSEQLKFKVDAADDFGVREIGMEWKGLRPAPGQEAEHGERVVKLGGPDQNEVSLESLFTATSLGIEPQPIELRLYAVDYLPGRTRAYSAAYVLQVLDKHEHATWVTQEIAQLYKKAIEVRDREKQLHETNKQLRSLSAEEIATAEVQRQISTQAASEMTNGRNLRAVANKGTTILKHAARNSEMDPNGVAALAEMLVTLNDMADNRMPSIANLMKESVVDGKPKPQSSPVANMQVGASRSGLSPGRKKIAVPRSALPPGMKLTDMETSHQPDEDASDEKPQKKKASAAALDLASTTLKGRPSRGPAPDAKPGMDKAVDAQEKLLEDFARLADEMNEVMSKLEGATFIKRLKSTSREQTRIASALGEEAELGFGVAPTASVGGASSEGKAPEAQQELTAHSELVQANVNKLATIMDDMYAYSDRVGAETVARVLEEMRTDDVLGSMRTLATEIPVEPGTSVGQLEYWADVTDRWAEDLLTSAGGCKCPGGGWKASLPPEIVLEVLKILEAEIALREETRMVQSTKLAMKIEKYGSEAERLGHMQDELKTRTEEVVMKIEELPTAGTFGKQIKLLNSAADVMDDAVGILERPNTGGEAIAAESDAIEILLEAKRAGEQNMGAADNPGGGSTGSTTNPALALIGQGLNAKAAQEESLTAQAVGKAGRELPPELQSGLDRFYQLMESDGSN